MRRNRPEIAHYLNPSVRETSPASGTSGTGRDPGSRGSIRGIPEGSGTAMSEEPEFFTYTREEFLDEFVHPDDRQAVEESRHRRTAQSPSLSFLLTCGDASRGSPAWLRRSPGIRSGSAV